MKNYKIIQFKCFRRIYLKTSKNRGCGNISPQFLKIKMKGKGEERKVTHLLFTLCLKLTGKGLLVFFYDELTTFRNRK